jgi:hypothetical protein
VGSFYLLFRKLLYRIVKLYNRLRFILPERQPVPCSIRIRIFYRWYADDRFALVFADEGLRGFGFFFRGISFSRFERERWERNENIRLIVYAVVSQSYLHASQITVNTPSRFVFTSRLRNRNTVTSCARKYSSLAASYSFASSS